MVKVTEQEKKQASLISSLYGGLSGLIICIVGIGLTAMLSEKTATKEDIKTLQETKANIEYVDKRCLQVQQAAEMDKVELNTRLDRMEDKQDKTLDYIIELNKRK